MFGWITATKSATECIRAFRYTFARIISPGSEKETMIAQGVLQYFSLTGIATASPVMGSPFECFSTIE